LQRILERWAALDRRQRLAAVAALVATVAMTALVASIGGRESRALLYAGLEPGAAGQVVTALDARGVDYLVQGTSILVPEAQRDSLRMALASEGLPALGGAGYELLDTLSGFGTTAQMFDAAYWRAKEGELARTIVAGSRIRSARVHISAPPTGSFARRTAAAASVTVQSAVGPVDLQQARALRYLVASAVPGLSPTDVAVIDSEGGLIDEEAETGAKAAQDRSDAMRARVERLLEARVGPGNAVVEVSVETETERERITERTLDPEGRVAISTDSEERSGTSQGGGDVTVASNLPDGDAGGEGARSQDSETRERVNYEVSETRREIEREPGDIRRLTVAVLVDGVATQSTDGASVVPRGEEELEALRALVASAVGFDEARGDTITIRSMAFGATEAAIAEAGPNRSLTDRLDPMRLVQVGVAAIVALVLGLFVLRPILAGRGRAPALPALAAAPSGAGPAADGEVLSPGDDAYGDADGLDLDAMDFSGGGMGFDEPEGNAGKAQVRRLIEANTDESMEVLRGWLETKETAS
jgi:flagellar M-ring protein FliF